MSFFIILFRGPDDQRCRGCNGLTLRCPLSLSRHANADIVHADIVYADIVYADIVHADIVLVDLHFGMHGAVHVDMHFDMRVAKRWCYAWRCACRHAMPACLVSCHAIVHGVMHMSTRRHSEAVTMWKQSLVILTVRHFSFFFDNRDAMVVAKKNIARHPDGATF